MFLVESPVFVFPLPPPPLPPHHRHFLSARPSPLCLSDSLSRSSTRFASCLSGGNPGITRGTIPVAEACCSRLPPQKSCYSSTFSFASVPTENFLSRAAGEGCRDGEMESQDLQTRRTSLSLPYLASPPLAALDLFFCLRPNKSRPVHSPAGPGAPVASQ